MNKTRLEKINQFITDFNYQDDIDLIFDLFLPNKNIYSYENNIKWYKYNYGGINEVQKLQIEIAPQFFITLDERPDEYKIYGGHFSLYNLTRNDFIYFIKEIAKDGRFDFDLTKILKRYNYNPILDLKKYSDIIKVESHRAPTNTWLAIIAYNGDFAYYECYTELNNFYDISIHKPGINYNLKDVSNTEITRNKVKTILG